jgi:hypothetical protein
MALKYDKRAMHSVAGTWISVGMRRTVAGFAIDRFAAANLESRLRT